MLRVKILLSLIMVLCSFILILEFVKNAPYFYIGIEAFLILVVITKNTKKSSNFKAVLFNLAIVIFFLTLAEAYFAGLLSRFGFADRQNKLAASNEKFYCSGKFHITDEIRGFTAANNARVNVKLVKDGKAVYDAIYTTNQYGLRVSPHDLTLSVDNGYNDFKNVVFFGCSFTFGLGVNDNETIPYLFEEKTAGKYRTYNFALDGYGPQHMLRILETGLMDKFIIDRKPSIAIYIALLHHILRSSNNYPYNFWGYGPKYTLSTSGDVSYLGQHINFYLIPILHKLTGSYLLHKITAKFFGNNKPKEAAELFLQIVKKSREIFIQKYNGKFYVILWTEKDNKYYNYLLSELKRNHVKVITTEEIFRESKDPYDSYFIKNDGHPNKLAYERIAGYLLKAIP